ncbi:M20/M25/M40 family metallo-hydrolase [Roseibium sediminicola]|uniref:M20/M25/M40 family metallo-hydrolase n=1 Tax=Roseibium sediminicola TaxID=2933272 RepID=A0ABT0H2Q3_9HYPH|nr:M20/M25/M40 family metallo-hydrolase [Roseibium sp. CAU 1639]MCK7615946.1 M20/M25/M40 family metallo-hydrolase [Roseibium sp. CAU 1639]
MSTIEKVLARIDADLDKSLVRLFELLKIKSISTDPVFKTDCRAAAEWLSRELTDFGIDANVRDTDGHPMVVGHKKTGKSGPHVLFYGHYDVQPVDPPELWHSDPFDPKIVIREDGTEMIVARGAADDKGQLMTFVEAARAYVAETGDLPIDVSILLEGEEETGSPSLHPFLIANKDELTCDLALVCDSDMWDAETPAVTVMLRGLVSEEVSVKAAGRDLHSGMYGGAARNPIHVIADIVANLHDHNGKVTLEGFYDGVVEMPLDVKHLWEEIGFDAKAFLNCVDLEIPAGETDRSLLEQIWTRPTAEVNGIIGGYAGAGFKTVIPAEASLKISFRLVGNQDPVKVRDAFRSYVHSKIPADCSVDFKAHGGSPALRLDFDNPALTKGKNALSDEWGKTAVLIGCGGSIPIVGDFKTMLGMDSMLIGFGLDDDAVHSPNEKYNMKSFHKGIRSWARILDALSKE